MDKLERIKRAVEANGINWTSAMELELTRIAISLTSNFPELEMVERLVAYAEENSD